jgi:hypothetical protein
MARKFKPGMVQRERSSELISTKVGIQGEARKVLVLDTHFRGHDGRRDGFAECLARGKVERIWKYAVTRNRGRV